MTTQVPEVVRFGGVEYPTRGYPLEPYLLAAGMSSPEIPSSTGLVVSNCWRGYVGHWDIASDQLRLLDLRRYEGPSRPEESILATVFPHASPPIAATWFSGELRLQVGPIIRYDYAPVYKEEIVLTILDGGVTHVTRVVPRVPVGPALAPVVDDPDTGVCPCGGRIVAYEDARTMSMRCEACGRVASVTSLEPPEPQNAPDAEQTPGAATGGGDGGAQDRPTGPDERIQPRDRSWAWIYGVDPTVFALVTTWLACMVAGTGAGATIGAVVATGVMITHPDREGYFDWGLASAYFFGVFMAGMVHGFAT